MGKKKKQATPLPKQSGNREVDNPLVEVPIALCLDDELDLIIPGPEVVHPSAGAIPRKDAEIIARGSLANQFHTQLQSTNPEEAAVKKQSNKNANCTVANKTALVEGVNLNAPIITPTSASNKVNVEDAKEPAIIVEQKHLRPVAQTLIPNSDNGKQQKLGINFDFFDSNGWVGLFKRSLQC